jgi:hypothetical protein
MEEARALGRPARSLSRSTFLMAIKIPMPTPHIQASPRSLLIRMVLPPRHPLFIPRLLPSSQRHPHFPEAHKRPSSPHLQLIRAPSTLSNPSVAA